MSLPWTVLPLSEPSPELRAAVGGHPLVARLLAQRGFDTPARALPFLDPAHYTPAAPTSLVGLEQAAERIHQALESGKNILVWGDFDVDGQTSTSLLVAALRDLAGESQAPASAAQVRASRIRFHVPNRFGEGHGIQPEVLATYLDSAQFQPHLLLTCDTGIAEAAAVGLARDRGLAVVITDHHDLTAEFADYRLGAEPPAGLKPTAVGRESVRRADALVNPKFQPLDDPLRTLPGVGVAYKLVQQLYLLAARSGEAEQFLDLVALGIVADVAEQVGDARYLLQQGLERLRNTRRIGLKALMNVTRLNPARVDAEAIGFQLGPRMNALGRLQDATVAVELLTTTDAIRAGQLAGQMEHLNRQRQLLTSQITATALEMVERTPRYLEFNGLVLAHPNWHAGIVGIVASRLVEEYHKPTVLLLNPPGEPARGSARSVPGVDIGAAIAGCGPLLLSHGGHPGAAGLALPAENIDRFRRELDRQIELNRTGDGEPGLRIDTEWPFHELSIPLAEQLERLAPFGNGNPKPHLLSRGLEVSQDQRVGRDGTHRRLVLQCPNGSRQPVIWFRGADVELPLGPIDLVYTLGIQEYQGEQVLQITYVASRPAQAAQVAVEAGRAARYQVHDLRGQAADLADLPGVDGALWVAEGLNLGPAPLHSRLDLARTVREAGRSGQPLVVWSVPPSAELLAWTVETARPSVVYLCGQMTGVDALDGVLKAVAGMVKYALARDRRLPVDRLAARLGSTESVVRHSLLWLEAKGLVRLEKWLEGDVVQIAAGDGAESGADREILQAQLAEQLAEVRAYRRYFLRARLRELGLN